MTETRLPVSVAASLALHLGAGLLYLHLAQSSRARQARTIANVDLLIQVRKSPQARLAAKPPPPSTLDFLKLALPALPKMELKAVQVKAPELKKPLVPLAPRLEDKGRLKQLEKLESLDLGAKRAEMAKIESKALGRKAAALAALPRLEEVGRRRVRNLPQAMALEERRREAVEMKRLEALAAPTHRRLPQAMEALQEAQAPERRSRFAETVSGLLPSREEALDLQPEMRAAPPRLEKSLGQFVSPLPERSEAARPEEKKKAVEIEGPLADRRIASYVVPAFPEWARSQGILEAAVAIRFAVGRDGRVLPEAMRVERTSGYGRLDRLAMDALKDWVFEPLASDQRQWGVITFRFVLE